MFRCPCRDPGNLAVEIVLARLAGDAAAALSPFAGAGRSTRMVPDGACRAGTGNRPAFHQRQAVMELIPSRLAHSESFILEM